MTKQGFLVLLKRVFEVHMQSAGVIRWACSATGNLVYSGEHFIVALLFEDGLFMSVLGLVLVNF